MTIVTMPRLAALALALALPASAHAAPCAGFTDVDDQSSFCASVEWMKNRGITLGLTPTLYDPDSPVTRLQMAAFMYRLGFQNAFLKGGNAFGATAVLGTTDAHDVEIVANGIRALHVRGVQDGIFSYVNIAAGHPLNAVQLTCATILQCLLADPIRGGTVAGGGHHDPLGSNRVTDSYATVSGGRGNLAGNDNADEGDSALATVGGGENNEASASRATIGGGSSNHAFAALATIGGGELNIAAGRGATVPGGEQNFAVGDWSLAAGFRARADHHGTFRTRLPDLAVIDVGLGDEPDGGFTLCRELRAMSPTLPIIFLSARDSDFDIVAGLRIGADDYLTKDASLHQLTARIAALFRRSDLIAAPPSSEDALTRGDLVLDVKRLTARWKGAAVPLTLTEFWMVHSLARHPGHVKDRDALMRDANIVVDDSTITSHVKRIRRKFQAVDASFDHIATVYGMGYRWIEPGAA